MEKIKGGDIIIYNEDKLTPVIGVAAYTWKECGKEVVSFVPLNGGGIGKVEQLRVRKIDLSNVASAITYKGENCIDVMSWDGRNEQAKCSSKDNFNFLYGLCLAASRIKKSWPQKGDTVYSLEFCFGDIKNVGFRVINRVYAEEEGARELIDFDIKNGFVFKTREAAEAALAKIKAVFAANKEALEHD